MRQVTSASVCRSVVVAAVLTLVITPVASAAVILTQVGRSGFGVQLADGSSNTIAFGENTVLDVCVPASAFPATIQDGTSNTLLLTESVGLRARWASRTTGSISDGTSNTLLFGEDTCLRGIVAPEPVAVPPGEVVDGSSNTILFGEQVIDLRDRAFSVCFARVRVAPITDGTSNTILIGEQGWSDPCYGTVRSASDLQVPGPAAGTLLTLAVGAALRRRRRAA